MMKLGAASLVLGLAAGSPEFDDSAVLVQHRYEMERDSVELDRPLISFAAASNAICTDKMLEDYNSKMDAWYKLKRDTDQQKKLESFEKNFEKLKKHSDEIEKNTTAYLQPMLTAVDGVGKYLEAECQPTGLKIVKGLLQFILKGPLVGPVTIDVNKTVNAFVERWDKEISVHTRHMLNSGFALLHDKIEQSFQKLPPKLRVHIQDAPYPVHNETELNAYVQNRTLPVVGLEVDSQFRAMANVLAELPENVTNPEMLKTWTTKTLVPQIMAKLPAKCQTARLMTTMSLGGGEMGERLTKFAKNCALAMGFSEEEEGPAMPARHCKTCVEVWKEATTGSSPNSCAMHCLPSLTSCLQAKALDDKCIHSFFPCLRCHKRKIDALDKCEGDTKNQGVSEMLGQLLKAADKTSSVEKASVGRLMDTVLDGMAAALIKPAGPK
mmetsp:Transcript_1579/g.4351  ORF Transcript_1579/g.4351 Transcript_1579/m.4351 type:complete len:438 (-) Transcript_1579:730-2043(-)